MPYTSVERVKLTIPALSSATNITSADIADFITRADTIIDAKLARYYVVPLSNIPLIETLSVDITGYLLLSRRIAPNEKKDETTWPDKYRESLRLLDDLRNNKIDLVNSSGDLIARRDPNTIIGANTDTHTPTFGEWGFEESFVDPDK